MIYRLDKILLVIILIYSLVAVAADTKIMESKPIGMISDIKFSGIYPFFSSELSEIMTIQPGDSTIAEIVQEQSKLISDFYQRQGFADCKVSTELQPASNNNSLLKVTVNKGGYASINKVNISGNSSIFKFMLLKESTLWRKSFIPGPEGRFTTELLEKDLLQLAQYYRERHYFDAKVTVEVKQDSSKNTVVNFIVVEGSRYNLTVSGNDHLSDSDFDEIAAKVANNGFGGEEILRRIKRQITTRYLVAGFNSTQFSYWQLPSDSLKNVLEVKYQIKENTRPLVTSCNFEGNHSLRTKDLKRYLLSVYSDAWSWTDYFNERLAEEDVNSLEEFYRQQGFLKCRVNLVKEYSVQNDSVDLTFKFDEKAQTLVGKLQIDSLPTLPAIKLEKILKLQSKDAYRILQIEEEIQGLKTLLVSNGYLDCNLELVENFSADSTIVDLRYKITPGLQIMTGEVIVSGNLVTKPSVIINQLRLQKGKPILADKLADGLKALRDQPVYKSITLQSNKNSEHLNTRDIAIKVRENPPYYAESALGYESSTGALASCLLGNRNLLGRNLDFNGRVLYSQAEKSLIFSLTEPLFMSLPLAANLQIYGIEENILNSGFKTLIVGSGLGFKYKWDNLQTSVYSGNFETRQIDSLNIGYDISKINRYLINLTAEHQIDTRNSFVRPVEGSFMQFRISGTGGLSGLKDNFVKYHLDLRTYRQLSDNVFSAMRFSGSFLQEYDGGKQPLPDQLFYLGGASSIRGIGENLFVKDKDGKAVGGKTAIIGSLELRPQFENNWEIPIFTDLGFFIYKKDIHRRVFRITTGSGIRYLTSFGAFGVLYGFPLGEGDSILKGCFHFSAGYSF